MNITTIVKTLTLASFLFSAICQADSSSGMATGKRQHKPVSIMKEIDKATPILSVVHATPSKVGASAKVRTGYRLCPDGSMIHPGEKCPEKSAKR